MMPQTQVIMEPMERLKESPYGIIGLDCCTRWVELFALPQATARECATTLMEEVILQYGLPRRLISDHGSQFVGAVLQQLCFILNIDQDIIPVYHPQANPVERKNRDLKPRIAILVQNRHDEWEDKLPSIRFALNSAKWDTTDNENFVPEITPYLKRLARISSEVRERIEEKQDQRKTFYDKRHCLGPLYHPATEEQEEKKKNIEILESILGYEVIEKYNTEGQKSMKRQKMVRFDPEDENASEFLETPVEKPPKESRKKQEVEEKTEEKEIPISTERFVEVNANLKELLKSSAPTFSLSEKFSSKIENVNDFSFSFPTKEDLQSNKEIQKDSINTPVASQYTKNIFEDGKKFLFFISENDEMLKEGVDFFQRKETVNELYEQWNKRRDGVQEIFRRKRKIFEKGAAPRNGKKRYGKK
ncbi:integrase catalytic domain-containing protein [Trichonephila clavipes]|nr:integrase catalytic domain-containing protein [Trichonephila clavipes]